MPVWNQLEFTQQCIAALKNHTRPAWELIVVDNGSTDGTGTYLAGVRDMSTVPVTVVSNATNLGFPAAINQGLRLARGEYLVMLNNDVVVTDGWLDQLIALVNAKRGPSAEQSPPYKNVSSSSAAEYSLIELGSKPGTCVGQSRSTVAIEMPRAMATLGIAIRRAAQRNDLSLCLFRFASWQRFSPSAICHTADFLAC